MPDDRLSWQVVGPLNGKLIVTDEDGKPRFRRDSKASKGPRTVAAEANPLLILHRTAVARFRTDTYTGEQRLEDLDDTPIRIWAVDTNLGQKHSTDPQKRKEDLDRQLAARRARALNLLADDENHQVMVVKIEPQAALITGTATGGIRNVGIELHGTHGWPVIPASGLKGVTVAYAQDVATQEEIERIFGSPRPGRRPEGDTESSAEVGGDGEPDAAADEQPSKPGSVLFFDAMPGSAGISVAEHDLTPHARDYHTGTDSAGKRPPPAEYVNPVPIPFLVVDGGAFIAHLVGPAEDVTRAAELLCAALDDIGAGAKTSSGYGYLTAKAELLTFPAGD